jgi:hypothetical protein
MDKIISKTYGQSTKESYRDDIESSIKCSTIYKNYEYFDDYSYGSSQSMGFYLEKDEDEDDDYYLYLFQEDGPKDIETLNKFLEWRRSGKSDEIGHKGGGNKRNIYGFKCIEAFICMKINEKQVIRCSTKPNLLYELATADIDEETFRSESDSSKYITNPDTLRIKNLPGWYTKTCDKIKKESGINPNFLIRLELSEIPEDYTEMDKWTEYLNQVRAKQYGIPIHFKNEFLKMEEYNEYEIIDLVGFNDADRTKIKNIKLYINKNTKQFYFENDGKFVNSKDKNDIVDNHNDIIEWGEINMFIISKGYFNNQLKIFNDNNPNPKKAEDFYGVYLLINDKLTNYLPVPNILTAGKNNGIEDGASQNTNRFRIVFKPNNDNCRDNDIFDSLIQTREIKALTGFLDKSPWNEIVKCSMKIYKGLGISTGNGITNKPKKEKKSEKNKGGVYMVYLGNGLWKYGMVEDYKGMDNRMDIHKSECIKKIKEFNNLLNYKEEPKTKKCIIVYKKETSSPKGDEEKIASIINKYKSEKIKIIECDRSSNSQREYFICDNFDYISDYIVDRCNIDI